MSSIGEAEGNNAIRKCDEGSLFPYLLMRWEGWVFRGGTSRVCLDEKGQRLKRIILVSPPKEYGKCQNGEGGQTEKEFR